MGLTEEEKRERKKAYNKAYWRKNRSKAAKEGGPARETPSPKKKEGKAKGGSSPKRPKVRPVDDYSPFDKEVGAMQIILDALTPLSEEGRARVWRTVEAFFKP